MLHVRKMILQRGQLRFVTRNITKQKSAAPLTLMDMPHPLSWPIVGTKLNFLVTGSSTTLHDYVHQRHTQLGPIFCESLGGRTKLVFVSEPELIKSLFLNLEGKYPLHILPEPWLLYEKLYACTRGLFFMNGEEWLVNRRIMNKHLLREGTDKWLEMSIKDTVNCFVQDLKVKVGEGNFTSDLESEFYRLSLNVIINIFNGTETALMASKHMEELLQIFSQSVKRIFETTNRLYSLPVYWCERFNLRVWRDFKESVDLSLFLGKKIVKEMLSMRHKSNGLIGKIEGMDDATITSIVTDLIIAGGDTTAYTTMWILLLLSKNDEVKKEIFLNNAYAKHVVKETMRLYPVAPFLTRILTKEGILGSYQIKEGTPIVASIYTSGRDEGNFSRANEFLPYRWDRKDPRKQDLANHVTSASLPFAFGARSCVGQKIAIMQLSEITKQIVNNFDFKCTNTKEIKPIMSMVLVPERKIKLSITVKESI